MPKRGLKLKKKCLEDCSKRKIVCYSEHSYLSQRTERNNIICTMDDVRGDFLGPPHGTTPAAVIVNKI